jgi:hypothetical protein
MLALPKKPEMSLGRFRRSALTDVNGLTGALIAAAALLLAACQPISRVASPNAPAPVTAAARPALASPAKDSRSTPKADSLPSMDLPPGPIYFCDVAGVRSALALPEGSEALCRRHPEMGPCKYERESCRQRGGRVFTSKGEEITRAVEDAYDQRVRRVRISG